MTKGNNCLVGNAHLVIICISFEMFDVHVSFLSRGTFSELKCLCKSSQNESKSKALVTMIMLSEKVIYHMLPAARFPLIHAT